jgi:hypothetical protein
MSNFETVPSCNKNQKCQRILFRLWPNRMWIIAPCESNEQILLAD